MNADWFPPALRPQGEPEARTTPTGADYLRVPFTPEVAYSVSAALRAGVDRQRRIPLERLLAALDRTHARLGGPELASLSGPVAAATGYAPEAVRRSLALLFSRLRRPDLEQWLTGSGIRPDWLDGTLDAAQTLVFGPRLSLVVSSGNVPGAALPSLVQALLLKSPVIVKTSSTEPVLLPRYAAVLAEEDPEVAAGLVVTGWPGGDAAIEDVLLPQVDALIAYGADRTLESLRRRLPAHARFLGYGHRVSVTAIARDALDEAAEALARGVALDAALFDQQGCLSPQAVYVEQGSAVPLPRFAESIAGHLGRLAEELPRGAIDPGAAAAIHQYRAAAEMRALSGGQVWSSPGTDWTVAIEPGLDWVPGPGNRTVILREIPQLEQLAALLAPLGPGLISCGLAASPPRRAALIPALAGAGFTRFTEPGGAQSPAEILHHDGVSALAALARFVVVEEPTPGDPETASPPR